MFCGDVETETPPPRAGLPLAPAFRILVGDREIVLGRGEHVLGRSSEASVFVDDTGVSRQHARITIGEHGAKLEDLGSKNGTVLNGQVIRDCVDLADGALIVLGATALKFCVFQTTGSTETLSRPTELDDGLLPK
jgi:pSer/pThr/pTyr-binding forkhead associated (FHA) protein